jgi:adenylate cyclase
MEIERKWLVAGWPEGRAESEEFAMRQGYVSVRPTVRIREEALRGGPVRYILCFKSAGGLSREEIETEISPALFRDLETRMIAKPLIPKVRRSYPLPGGLVLEVNAVDAARRPRSGMRRWSFPPRRPRGPGSRKRRASARISPAR